MNGSDPGDDVRHSSRDLRQSTRQTRRVQSHFYTMLPSSLTSSVGSSCVFLLGLLGQLSGQTSAESTCPVNIAAGQNAFDQIPGFSKAAAWLGDPPLYVVRGGQKLPDFRLISDFLNGFMVGHQFSTIPFLMWTTSTETTLNYGVSSTSSDLDVSSPLTFSDSTRSTERKVSVFNGHQAPSEEVVPEYVMQAPCDGKQGIVTFAFDLFVRGGNNCTFDFHLEMKKICRDCHIENVCRSAPTTIKPSIKTPTTSNSSLTNASLLISEAVLNHTETTEAISTKASSQRLVSIAAGGLLLLIFILAFLIAARRKITSRKNLPVSTDCEIGDSKALTKEKWLVNPNGILFHEKLGEGAFGSVFRATWNAGTEIEKSVAVKCLKVTANKEQVVMMTKEIEVMKAMKDVDNVESHPNILRMIGYYVGDYIKDSVILVLELMEMGNLLDYLQSQRNSNDEDKMGEYEGEAKRMALTSSDYSIASYFGDRPEPLALECLQFADHVACGMQWMEENYFVHRDLAARNVLLTEKSGRKIAKLSDFGMGREVYESGLYKWEKGNRVPVKWWAPEALELYVCTTKGDVWSYGVVLWEIGTLGNSPYPGIALTELLSQLKAGLRLPKPDGCSQEAYELMLSCWKYSPHGRPTFKEIHLHLQDMMSSERDYLPIIIKNP